MCRECRECFPRHRWLAIPTCITCIASRTCRDASRDRWLAVSVEVGVGQNVRGIPDACATSNFTYLVRDPWICLKVKRLSPSCGWVLHSLPGPRFNKKMSYYQYWKSHCGDKTVVRSSYLHNGISYTGKIMSLYQIRARNNVIIADNLVTPGAETSETMVLFKFAGNILGLAPERSTFGKARTRYIVLARTLRCWYPYVEAPVRQGPQCWIQTGCSTAESYVHFSSGYI